MRKMTNRMAKTADAAPLSSSSDRETGRDELERTVR